MQNKASLFYADMCFNSYFFNHLNDDIRNDSRREDACRVYY